MVLPKDIAPVLQPNLLFEGDQEDIISRLNLTWKFKSSVAEYMWVSFVLEQEEEKAQQIQVAIERALLDQRFPLLCTSPQ